MSTRACYVFKNNPMARLLGDRYVVYGHQDGYPTGALEKITAVLTAKLCWELPRYEAADFAAGFIAANKDGGGGIYITTDEKHHGDLAYTYEITFVDEHLWVRAYKGNETKPENEIFSGSLASFALNAEHL